MEHEIPRVVVTHDGVQHGDEAMAVAIVNLARVEDHPLDIVRTRAPAKLNRLAESGAILCDVGDGEFDHHGPKQKRRLDGYPYAAAGLVWREFGHRCVEAVLTGRSLALDLPTKVLHRREASGRIGPNVGTIEVLESVWREVDVQLMRGIDAQDNGARVTATLSDPREVRVHTASQLVGLLNELAWFGADENEVFLRGVRIMEELLECSIMRAYRRIGDRSFLRAAVEAQADPLVLVLGRSVLEVATLVASISNQVLFVVSPGIENISNDPEGSWGITAVPVNAGSRESRCLMPSQDGGRTMFLSSAKILMNFVHAKGFYAVAPSRESAIQYARFCVQQRLA